MRALLTVPYLELCAQYRGQDERRENYYVSPCSTSCWPQDSLSSEEGKATLTIAQHLITTTGTFVLSDDEAVQVKSVNDDELVEALKCYESCHDKTSSSWRQPPLKNTKKKPMRLPHLADKSSDDDVTNAITKVDYSTDNCIYD